MLCSASRCGNRFAAHAHTSRTSWTHATTPRCWSIVSPTDPRGSGGEARMCHGKECARARAGTEADTEEGRRGGRRRRRAGDGLIQGERTEGGDGRHPRRDRLRAGGERRGVRQVLRPEGRGVSDRIELPLAGTPFGARPSFVDLVRREHPEAMPSGTGEVPFAVPHGTTVLGLKFAGGILMAGDRRATAGNIIADAKMRKVFAADDYSAIAIAGVAGQAIELVKLFQLELEHYEKITGDRLSLEGKANRLAQMIRGNLPAAMQGLVVVPLFGGYDESRDEGRIFYYDATGGRWEEDDYQTTGSGSLPAKNSLKKRWRAGLSRDQALRVAAEALIDAADDDSATGGPNIARGIYPVMIVVTADGAVEVSEQDVHAAIDEVLAGMEGEA